MTSDLWKEAQEVRHRRAGGGEAEEAKVAPAEHEAEGAETEPLGVS